MEKEGITGNDATTPLTYAEIDEAIKKELVVRMNDGFKVVILSRDRDTLDTIITGVRRETYKLNDVVRIGLEYGDISLKEQIRKHAPDVYAQRYSTTVPTGKSVPVALVDSGSNYSLEISLDDLLEQAKRELLGIKAEPISKKSHILGNEKEVKKKIEIEGYDIINSAFNVKVDKQVTQFKFKRL